VTAPDRATRRRLGAWYTPAPLVSFVLDQVGPLGGRVLDPACGDGRFLAEVVRRSPGASVVGVDIDPGAIAQARDAVPCAELRLGDALDVGWDGPYDTVVGNPPFLGQMAAATTRGGRSPLGGGTYADTAALFLALAVRLARPDGGRIGLVLPTSLLATRDAQPIRRAVLADARLDGLWWAGTSLFDAAVDTCVVILVRGEAQGDVRRWQGPGFTPAAPVGAVDLADRSTWSHLLSDLAGIPSVAPHTAGSLGDLATATAGFREQFYGLAPFVGEGDAAPLVTCGLIDAGRSAWGERPARFAGRVIDAPSVDIERLGRDGPPRLTAWVRARRRPKVLVATQTRVIEACVDTLGTWVPSVPVVSVEPLDPADLWRVAAVLCSPVASAVAASRFLGAGMAPGALKLSARQLLDLPCPASPWDDAADGLAGGDLDRCAVATTAAYGLAPDHPVLVWWRAAVARQVGRISGG
jgi:SAM-dependent methyltransferase